MMEEWGRQSSLQKVFFISGLAGGSWGNPEQTGFSRR